MGKEPVRPPLEANYIASLRLRPTADAGRRYPVKRDYRPNWWAGTVLRGKRKYLGSRVYPVEPEQIEPGHVGLVHIAPDVRADWEDIVPGTELTMFEGSREYGWATIVEVRRYREPENPWEEDDMDFSGATVAVQVVVAGHGMVLEFRGVKSHPEASDAHDIRLELGKIAFVAWSCAEIPGARDTVKRFRLRPPDEFWLSHQPLVPDEFRWARNYSEQTAVDSIHNLWEMLLECPTYRLQVLCDDWGSPGLSWKLAERDEQP